MKKKIVYTKGPITKLKLIPDFLPSPEELVFKQRPETVKVTLTLEKNSVDFFKTMATKHGSSYQRMMRNLLSSYASKAQSRDPNREA